MRRHKLSRKSNRRNFRGGTRVKRRNLVRSMRGGIRA